MKKREKRTMCAYPLRLWIIGVEAGLLEGLSGAGKFTIK